PVIRDALPSFVLKYRTLAEFWAFIKPKFVTWRERLEFLQNEFDPLMTALERGEAPSGQPAPSVHTAQPAEPRPDVVLITVNEHETRALLDEFKAATGRDLVTVPLEGRVYHDLGTLNGTRVFHAVSGMGTGGTDGMQVNVDKAIRAL